MKPGGAVIRLGPPRWKRRVLVLLRVVVYGGLTGIAVFVLMWLTQPVPT